MADPTKTSRNALAIAVVAILGSGTVMLKPNARADPFTGTQGAQMEKRLCEKITDIQQSLRKEAEIRWGEHMRQPHAGVIERITALEAHWTDIKGDLTEIKQDIKDLAK